MTSVSSSANPIVVQSHVARDLLQSAALFKTDRLVVWEYVSNGLQYVDAGVSPIVRVTLDSKRKRIEIEDNGRGMDWTGLHNYFVMHGENLDRKEGKPGRGRFGTGKSAALGIADLLRITSTRDGKLSMVELSRSDISATDGGKPIPVRQLKREEPTAASNGTRVEIEGVRLRSLDQAGIIKYVERHLAPWKRDATVWINNHLCEFGDPPVAAEYQFEPEGLAKETLGEVTLIVKVAKAPLDEDLRGIAVLANGVWYATTLAGSEGREMSQYIFGEIDVPGLDDDTSPIPAFDQSRSMQLNPNNELVQTTLAFIGPHVDQVRRTLIDEDKRRRADDEARKLEKQAQEIARVINEDFTAFRKRVQVARAQNIGGVDTRPAVGPGTPDVEDDDLLFGDEIPAEIVAPTGGLGTSGGGSGSGGEPRHLQPSVVRADDDHDRQGRPAGGKDTQQRQSAGFAVRFDHLGAEDYRAKYVRDERSIYINLDHPQVSAALGTGSVEEPVFRRLAYEVAFSEYAIALASELALRDEYVDPSDPIFEIRETLNRVARKGAELYAH